MATLQEIEEARALVNELSEEELAQFSEQEMGKLEGLLEAKPDDEITEEQPEGISFIHRAIVKNLSNSPEASVKYLNEKFPDLNFELGVTKESKDRILVRKPGERGFKVLDPAFGEGFDPEDITDILFDVGSGVVEAVATAGGFLGGTASTGVGGLPAAVIAGGLAGALTESTRQLLAQAAGLDQEVDPKAIAVSSALGALLPAGTEAAKVVFKQVAKGFKGAGRAIYNTAFGKANEIARQAKKVKPGDILFDEKVWGRKATVLDQVEALKNKFGEEAERAVDLADEMAKDLPFGGKVISARRINDDVSERLIKDFGDSGNKRLETALKKEVEMLAEKQEPISIKLAQKRKKLLGGRFQEAPTSIEEVAREYQREALRGQIIDKANRFAPKAGDTIQEANDKFGSLATIVRQVANEAKADTGKKAVGTSDFILAKFDPQLAAAKKVVEVGGYPSVRTGAGRLAGRIGEAGLATSKKLENKAVTPAVSGALFPALREDAIQQSNESTGRLFPAQTRRK